MATALELGIENLKQFPPEQIALNPGVKWDKINNILEVEYFGKACSIQYPDIKFLDEKLTNREKILILHYLSKVKPDIKENDISEAIGFKDNISGQLYSPHIYLRIYKPLIEKFGKTPQEIFNKSKDLNGQPINISDFSVKFIVLPKIYVIFIIYPASEEFPPDVKVVFTPNIYSVFEFEDIIVMCEEIIRKL
jgi:hypothetical protein